LAAFTEKTVVSVTNDYGFAENYRTWRSDNAAVGTKTLGFSTSLFNNRRYIGPHSSGTTLTSAQILTLDDASTGTSNVSGTWAGTFTAVANGTGEYVYYTYPGTITGNPVFYIDGFETSFNNASTVSHTNDSGYAEAYQQWRSGQPGLGTTTVEVRAT